MAITYKANALPTGATEYVPQGKPQKPNINSEADAGSMKGYDPNLGVGKAGMRALGRPMPAKPAKPPLKVNGQGNVQSRGGRPTQSRGTSNGTMVCNAR
jgi:hypothetical protein